MGSEHYLILDKDYIDAADGGEDLNQRHVIQIHS